MILVRLILVDLKWFRNSYIPVVWHHQRPVNYRACAPFIWHALPDRFNPEARRLQMRAGFH